MMELPLYLQLNGIRRLNQQTGDVLGPERVRALDLTCDVVVVVDAVFEDSLGMLI